ncbi:MAG: ABC transporter ATP-binding protein [Clostridiaceae bacterium]|nr:ABC transporter ATP-binding protein [Clostridiaceae bacterium]
MSILEMKDVYYEYRNKYQTVRAVNGISCGFARGKIYALVGASGSGKTTVMSLLAGLDLPKAGTVDYEGVSTAQMDRDRYRREDVAVIYQGFNLFPLLTVLENTAYPMELRGMKPAEARRRAAERLRAVGLEDACHRRYPSMLSGGEQQRVAIARALCAEAKIILADEPTGNLDMRNSCNVVETLCRLAHELNYCVIIVTHDMAVAEQADTVMRMQDGRLISLPV